MSGLRLLFTFLFACSMTVLSGHASAQEQAVLERDAALLAEPRNGAPVVAQLKQGASGEVIARKAAWVNLKTAAGTGWLFSFNVRLVTAGSAGSAAGAPAAKPAIVGATPSRRVTATIGIRGLDEADLRQAHYDESQMQMLDGFAVSKQAAAESASSAGLTATRIDYLDKR